MPVAEVNRVPIALLKGIDQMREALLANTLRFAQGLPANNALLWGARGMGKSSLVKAVHAEVSGALSGAGEAGKLKLVEIHREDIGSLPRALHHLREAKDKTLHPVLRRPFLRGSGCVLQVAKGGARGRHRRPPRQCHLLCHVQPAAS